MIIRVVAGKRGKGRDLPLSPAFGIQVSCHIQTTPYPLLWDKTQTAPAD
jgi:hypothetical protein